MSAQTALEMKYKIVKIIKEEIEEETKAIKLWSERGVKELKRENDKEYQWCKRFVNMHLDNEITLQLLLEKIESIK